MIVINAICQVFLALRLLGLMLNWLLPTSLWVRGRAGGWPYGSGPGQWMVSRQVPEHLITGARPSRDLPFPLVQPGFTLISPGTTMCWGGSLYGHMMPVKSESELNWLFRPLWFRSYWSPSPDWVNNETGLQKESPISTSHAMIGGSPIGHVLCTSA